MKKVIKKNPWLSLFTELKVSKEACMLSCSLQSRELAFGDFNQCNYEKR